MARKLRIGSLLVLSAALCAPWPARAQGAWSAWSSANGGEGAIEYRWRANGMCLATGCPKDVEFRNNSKKEARFDYTIWSSGMVDAGEEVKDSGLCILRDESTDTVQATTGSNKVTRVFVTLQKDGE